jgi:hypothetical protein
MLGCLKKYSGNSLHNSLKRRVSSINLAIIDGYRPDGRKGLEEAGMKTAGQLYVEMFERCSSTPVQTKILYPADDDWKSTLFFVFQRRGSFYPFFLFKHCPTSLEMTSQDML